MALRFFWRCEGTTLSGTDDYSIGDTSATANGTPGASIDPAAALVGSNGILVTAGNNHFRFDNTAGASQIVDRSAGAVAFWFRIDTNPAALLPLFMVRGANANDYIAFYANTGFNTSTGVCRLQYRSTDTGGATVNVIATGTGLAEDTTYFGIIAWDQPNSLAGIWIYDSGGSLLQSATSSAAIVAPLDLNLNTGLRIGESTGSSVTCHIDNVFIGDAYADKDTFLTNRSITSYTAYGGGGASIVPLLHRHFSQMKN